jgi:hypothetical protein
MVGKVPDAPAANRPTHPRDCFGFAKLLLVVYPLWAIFKPMPKNPCHH